MSFLFGPALFVQGYLVDDFTVPQNEQRPVDQSCSILA
ncbi:MAG: hypothetical protein FD174_3565 [Geobacteraceae bacterium]|nr:MAG: hypothetical protein FD174_3565 [Geobacteraceae bacterium]